MTYWLDWAERNPSPVTSGNYTEGRWKLLVHTTETNNFYPSSRSYYGHSGWPHLTNERDGTMWQHIDLHVAARALKNLRGGVQTNRSRVIQVENCGYARDGNDALTDAQVANLRRLAKQLHEDFGMELRALPAGAVGGSASASAPQRMSYDEWRSYSGVVGHRHAPENCVAADTPVLCADLTWRPAGDLLPGDELVALDELKPADNQGRRLLKTVVTNNSISRDALLMVNTEQGSVRCNKQHPWLVKRRDKGQKRPTWRWVAAEDLVPGDIVKKLFEPWTVDRSWEAGWLAGMLDADGCLSLSSKGGHLSVAQRVSPTADEAMRVMKKYAPHVTIVVRSPEDRGPGVLGNVDMTQSQIQDRASVMEVLGRVSPVRFQPKYESLYSGAVISKLGSEVAIESIEGHGTGNIANLETESSTFVAAGFAMHNSHWDPGAFDLARLLPDTIEAGGNFMINHGDGPSQYVRSFQFLLNRFFTDTGGAPSVGWLTKDGVAGDQTFAGAWEAVLRLSEPEPGFAQEGQIDLRGNGLSSPEVLLDAGIDPVLIASIAAAAGVR